MQSSWIVWGTLISVAAVSLTIAVRTKWLQSHTLQKCVLLSVVLHGVLGIVCCLLGGLAPASWGRDDSGQMTMVMITAEETAEDCAPADSPAEAADVAPAATLSEEFLARIDAEVPNDVVPLLATPVEELPPLPTEVVEATDERSRVAEFPVASISQTNPTPARDKPASYAVPEAYADRVGARRAAAAAARGGSQETERAVQAALVWLVAAQSSDGRWSAARHGGGVERSLQGQHRQGAGAKSDFGVSGLALLALLGAGNTHRDGSQARLNFLQRFIVMAWQPLHWQNAMGSQAMRPYGNLWKKLCVTRCQCRVQPRAAGATLRVIAATRVNWVGR